MPATTSGCIFVGMNTLGKRIALLREKKGWNQSELAREMAVTPQSVQAWEAGKNVPRQQKMKKLAGLLGVTVGELMNDDFIEGEFQRLTADHLESSAEHSNVAPALQPRRAPRAYPLISWVAAGERAESPDNYYPGDGEEMLESTENAGEHGYWLRVKGRSMTSETPPSFPPGTPILVRPEGFDVISGKFYIAKHRDGETTFKQYVRDAGTAYLVPLNPAFNQVEMDDEWRLIGRVVDAKITGL